MNIKIADEILEVLNLINKNGYEAYVVGGYIRDALLGKANFDADITTSATPNKLKEIFSNYELEESFMGLGSIKFQFNDYHIEITTYRKEYEYINHRKPSKVEFTTSLKEDLIRRDFTINALCSDGKNIVDMFDGINDLEDKRIKTIGNPFVRFEEDALRILRALRFASKLEFSLDDVKEAIYANYKYLKDIAFETKLRELRGLLNEKNYINILKEYKDVLIDIFELDNLRVHLFSDSLSFEDRERLFFYDSQYNNLANKDIKFINDKKDLKRKLREYGKENIETLLLFKSRVLKEDIIIYNLLNNILNNEECYNLKMLAVNGENLLQFNIEKNKIGKHLNMLLDAVIEEKCSNEESELLEYLRNILNEEG